MPQPQQLSPLEDSSSQRAELAREPPAHGWSSCMAISDRPNSSYQLHAKMFGSKQISHVKWKEKGKCWVAFTTHQTMGLSHWDNRL